MNLWEYLQSQSSLHPNDVSLISPKDESETTYHQMWKEVLFTKLELRSLETQRILAIVPNCKETAILYLACMISGIDVCILGDGFAQEELNTLLTTFAPDTIVASSPDSIEMNQDSGENFRITALQDLMGSLLNAHVLLTKDTLEFSPGRQIVATSGSTGEPKMLTLSAVSLWNSAQVFASLYKLNYANTFWNFLPMSYLGGTFNLLLIPLASGGKVLMDGAFGAETLLRFFPTVNRFGINTIWLIPTILRGLRRLVGDRTMRLVSVSQKVGFIGTAPSLPEERRWIESVLGCQVYENYGLTETTFLLAEPLREEKFELSYGMQVFPGVQVESPKSQKSLKVKTPYLFHSYLGRSGIEQIVESEEWFDTKDFVELGAIGFLIKGRDREIVKKGGLLINLVEIENTMRSIINWGEVAAISIEDAFYGESYILLYEFGNMAPEEASIIGFLSKHISKTKMPSDVRCVAELPKTRSGKIDKPAALANYLKNSKPGESNREGG